MTIVKLLLQYLIGFYLLLTSLIFFSIGATSKIGALISIVCALIVLPLTRGLIEKSFNFKFATPMKYLVLILGFFAPMFFINSDETAEQKKLVSLPGISDSLSLNIDSLSNGSKEGMAISQNKNILPLVGSIKSKNKFADSKKSAKKKSDKSKAKSNYAGSSNTAYKSNKRKRTVDTRSSSSYRSSSGYCGHANKTGGNCRRRVKGGGYCWQHS